MIKVKQTGDRAVLSEGKSRGLGFALCSRLNSTTFETITPISACKDYLNDQVFTEHTGKSVEAYGIVTKKLNLFKDRAYIVATILPDKHSPQNTMYPGMADDIATLDANIENIQALLRYVESQFDIPVKEQTSILRAEGKLYVLDAPLYWTKYQYLISFYAFLVRMGMYYDGKMSPSSFLNEGFKHYVDKATECATWKQNGLRSKYLYLKGLKDHYFNADFRLSTMGTGTSVHNTGIQNFVFPDDFKPSPTFSPEGKLLDPIKID